MARRTVERLLEIIGEALSSALRLDSDLEARYPDFRRMVILRDRIIHGYDDVNDLVIRDIVRTNIPRLIVQLGMVTG